MILERLVVEMYSGGLSTRDIEDALCEISQDGSALPPHLSVSRLTEVLWEEYEAFQRQELSGFDIVYLFSDAVYESLRKCVGLREGILVSFAILSCGAKALPLHDPGQQGIPRGLALTGPGQGLPGFQAPAGHNHQRRSRPYPCGVDHVAEGGDDTLLGAQDEKRLGQYA